MKRIATLVGLAFLLVAPPAHAQQDGQWQAKNEAVSFTGTGENGTCEPQTIDPFTFDLLFGPGTEVRTLQDGQVTAVGNFDRGTGTVKVSRGGVSKTLTPDGKGGWTGSYISDGCNWTLNGETNEAGLVFVETEAAPEPAGEVATDAQQEGSGGMPLWIPFAVVVTGGAVIFLNRRHASVIAGGAAILEKSTPPLTFKNALVQCKSCWRTFEPIGNPFGGECPACGATWGNPRPLNEAEIPTTDEGREQMRRNAEAEWIRDREATKEKWLEDHPDGAPPGTPPPEVPGPADWGGRGDSLPRAPQG